MGTVKGLKAKLLVILIVFMIVFSNCGFTLAAIATSDGFQVITNGFFKKDEIDFDAYFEDEDGKEITKIAKDVNQKVRLILDILPQVDGYLKTAELKAVTEDDSDVNFKITDVKYYQSEEDDELDGKSNINLDVKDEEEGESKEESEIPENTVETDTAVENVVSTENTVATENVVSGSENVVTEDTVDELDDLSGEAMVSTDSVSEISNTTNENVVNEVSSDAQNTVSNSTIKNEVANETSNTVTNETENEVKNEVSNEVENNVTEETDKVEEVKPEEPASDSEEDILIDEEKVIEEKTEEATMQENLAYDMKVVSDNEIELKNIIKDTKIVLELEYKMEENLKVEDLMKNIKLQLSGTYINSDLEEVPVAKEAEVTLGWEYSKDVELTSEFTKFSPFEVGEIKGTIVENKISVKREITDEKYLPIKNTSLEVGVPEVNGKKPIEINVICEKLLATRGEDTGYTTFVKDNWSYDAESGKINISVENTNLVYTSGMDEYVIIYRYEDMIDAENSDLNKDVKLRVEEFSGEKNHIIEKEIKEVQNIKVDVGELITYNISSTEEKINKAKIYANYNNETPIYETEYTNQVNVNILTSDILEELKINCNQEVYKDVNGFEFAAEGIEYRKVKFSFSEISTLLVNGGEIVITNEAGDVLYTLNKDIIKSEEDCNINLNGESGIIIYAKNIAKNGNLNFELVKAIKKCNFEKSAFKNFSSIESKISAEVKYQKIEETLALPTIGTAKHFEESKTFATLSLNKETLSTTKSNDNVEIKIELNNDKEDSDLYVNPAFEVVFPKHVKNVTIQNVNVLYENGLRVKSIDTYTEHDITKIRAELEGVQKTFNESSITNGTNIIINANIEVDEYTPKKEDQIKLYYCNEGASTYQSQTKWSISKQIPNDILKTTNGFDVAIIKYQAPNGLIAINGIVNYDGNLSEVKSVKQGEVKKQIDINSSAKIMTMELLALNNTDNKCTDVVLLGRMPFAGVKDVITNEDLKVTTNTVMKDLIKEDIQNTNTVDIYYSNNPEATRDLDNIGNGWTKEVGDVSQVKSFLVVVKGAMQPGQVLRYTYDFEVPASLPYETNIEGSFGAFYNNNTDVAVVYESSVADTVGLVTEAGPKLEAIVTVDAGDGTTVGECRFLNYTVKVKNIGSVVATGLTVTNPIPNNTLLYVFDSSDLGLGNNNYVQAEEQTAPVWKIETLNPGEEKEFNFMVKTDEIRDDLEVIIKSKATVSAENLGISIESNETSNKLEDSYLDLMINTDTLGTIPVGGFVEYKAIATNISGEDLENVKVKCKLPKEFKYLGTTVAVGDNCTFNEETIVYDEEKNEITLSADKFVKNSFFNVKIKGQLIKSSLEPVVSYMSFYPVEGVEEKTSDVKLSVTGPIIEVMQGTNADTVLEGENVEFVIQIQNKGNAEAQELKITEDVSEYLKNVKVKISGNENSTYDLLDGKLERGLSRLQPNAKVVITISGEAKDLPEGESEVKIANQAKITGKYIDDILTDVAEIVVKENPDKVEEDPKDDEFDNIINGGDNDNNQDDSSDNNNNNDNSQDSSNGDSNDQEQGNNNNNNNSSNNDNNNTNQGSNNNNSQKPNDGSNNQEKEENKERYSISGTAWLDNDKNGRRDTNEDTLAAIKVQLHKDGRMLKAVTTDGNGAYKFDTLDSGNYSVIFLYDAQKYTTTNYRAQNVEDNVNSDAIETLLGTAVTNDIKITNENLSNIDIGLKVKDTFDLNIEKYLSKAIVKTAKNTKEYNFDDEKLAKVEIRAKEIEGARVDLEYLIEVENTGDVQGTVLKIVDQVPEGMTFDEKLNQGWYLGSDGNLYNETLKDVKIASGDKAKLKLVLTKTMTGENTGVISNKVLIIDTKNDSELKDNTDNNVSTQEVIITISTGGTTQAIIGSIITILFVFIVYSNREKINISFDKKYKNNDTKKKIKTKKIYK